MSDLWSEETSSQLLPSPWTCFPTGDADKPNLLVKLKVQTTPKLHVLILVTDLEECFFEGVNQRNLIKRLKDGLNDSQASQSQNDDDFVLGVGDEGEAQLAVAVNDFVEAVETGRASVSLEHAGYEHIVNISIPGSFSIRFICDALPSGPCLSTHLIIPLLGLSSSLLSLVKDEDSQLLTDAVDASAKAERLKEGRACRVFFDVGASALGRWVQGQRGTKEKDRLPIHLVKPTSRLTSPIPVRKPAASTSKTTPTDSTSKKSVGQQILSSAGQAGERVSWETQPPSPLPSTSRPTHSSATTKINSKSKGKSTATASDSEPDTDDAEELAPPPPQQSSPQKRRKDSPPDSDSMKVDPKPPGSDEEPDTMSEGEGDEPGLTQRDGTDSVTPPPTKRAAVPTRNPTPPPPTVDDEEEAKAKKKADKKKAEEDGENNARKIRMAKMKEEAAKKAAGGAAKKKKKL